MGPGGAQPPNDFWCFDASLKLRTCSHGHNDTFYALLLAVEVESDAEMRLPNWAHSAVVKIRQYRMPVGASPHEFLALGRSPSWSRRLCYSALSTFYHSRQCQWFSTPKLPLSVGISTPIYFMVPWAHASQYANGISIGSSLFS